jgi:hypothetical protein
LGPARFRRVTVQSELDAASSWRAPSEAYGRALSEAQARPEVPTHRVAEWCLARVVSNPRGSKILLRPGPPDLHLGQLDMHVTQGGAPTGDIRWAGVAQARLDTHGPYRGRAPTSALCPRTLPMQGFRHKGTASCDATRTLYLRPNKMLDKLNRMVYSLDAVLIKAFCQRSPPPDLREA